MSITLGGLTFSGPTRFRDWDPPYRAGIYAILMPGARTAQSFRVLYFGESGNMSERGFLRSHHKYACWIRKAKSEDQLYVSTHLMPNSNADDRRKVESQLVSQYNPDCN